MIRILFFVLLAVLGAGFANAQNAADNQLTLAPVFSDHMVLQRNKPIAVNGTGTAGSVIKVDFANKILHATADGSGKWKVVFPALKHGGPYVISVSAQAQKIVLKDVLIGDVWLCSGQSNMGFALQDAQTGPEELRTGTFNPNLRLLKMGGAISTGNVAWDSATLAKINQYEFFAGNWKTLNKASAASFSAIAYYFGKKITKEENVPIGLIQVALGGSPTESWIDRSLLKQDQQFAGMLGDWQNSATVMDWCRERAAVNTGNAKSRDQKHPFQPGYNFQAGIAPLTNFPISGVIWYQGESNVFNVPLHEQLFEMLVKSWRQRWGYEFPFYYVQLSGIDRPNWPEFRNSQRLLLSKIPNSGMAVSYDFGDSLNVHPIRKTEVGERLALLALHDTYKKNVVANGPIPAKAIVNEETITIEFREKEKLGTRDNKPLIGFEIVTVNGKRVSVNASIKGNEVVLNIPKNERIKTILYAYQPFTHANLYNEAGLPAPTFSMEVK
ncbi:sialate O-acetylesterase [Dyadobacter sp. CY323]|uniref:sialate O-acetylesterase n=1 Tax=Dyadobacter sp. CY323 TaxID=2907302 RepID=UPI001F316C82|nr:sialate O-acetylesterase [Dyadobacter sp. CY323]MCE6991169.1 sialate O-acetylesterase [Dyadobacter sp. CY323]